MPGEYDGWGKCFQVDFNHFAKCGLALSCSKITWSSFCSYSSHFSSMVGSKASIVVDSDLSWWFRSVWATHDKLHTANLTKCRREDSNQRCSALPLMLMHGQTYSMIFYAYCYRSVSTFHRRSRYDTKKKTFIFCRCEAAVHTWQDAVRRLSASNLTVPNVLAFESFPTFSNVLNLLCDQLLMILQIHLAPDMRCWILLNKVVQQNSP